MKMFYGTRYIDLQTIQKVIFCPKCKLEILGEKEEGYMEVEYEYCVDIHFESTEVSAKKISNIRKLDRSTSIPELKTKLSKQKDIRLGTYSRMQAEYISTSDRSKIKRHNCRIKQLVIIDYLLIERSPNNIIFKIQLLARKL